MRIVDSGYGHVSRKPTAEFGQATRSNLLCAAYGRGARVCLSWQLRFVAAMPRATECKARGEEGKIGEQCA